MLAFPGGLEAKDLAWPLLWCRFDSWPGKFPMPEAQHTAPHPPKKKVKKLNRFGRPS